MLKAGPTENDIAHHFGCSRQTIHYLMDPYNGTGYVRVRARPSRARVTTLHRCRVNTLLTHVIVLNATIIARLYGIQACTKDSHFVQNSGPGIFQHDHTRRK